MLNFKTIGKVGDSGSYAIRVFDPPFDQEKGEMIIINSINFVDDTEEVSVDYQSEYPDAKVVEEWIGKFVNEAIEHAITRAEALLSDQDNQTNQTL